MVLAVVACDLTDGGDHNCPEKAIAGDLARLFYWGGVDPDNWVPNEGRVVGSGDFVQWASSDRLIMMTETMQDGDLIRGVAEVALDPAGKFQSIQVHRFEHEVWDLRVDRDSGMIFVLYFAASASSYPTLGRLVLGAGDAMIDSVLLDESWKTWGVAPHPADETIVVNATQPGESDKAFYLLREGANEPIRILDGSITNYGARGTEVTQDSTLYYLIHFVGDYRSLIVRWDMRDGSLPVVIADDPGAADRLAVDPQDANRLLVHRRFYEDDGRTVRQDAIELMDKSTLVTTRLAVRTSVVGCRVIRNSFPDWKPDGTGIVFPAWSSSGGDEYPSSIWIKGPL